MPRTLVAAVFFASAALACADGQGSSVRAEAERSMLAGVEIVSYAAPEGDELALRYDTLATVGGSAAEEAEYQFDALPGGVAGDSSGNLYVADRHGKRVLKYDRDGRHVGSIGRPGRGPGELELPMAVRIGPGDSVWVSDPGNQRILIYAADGTYGREIAFDLMSGFPSSTFAVGEYGIVQQMQLMRMAGSGAGSGTPLVLHDLEMEPRDTLWVTEPREENSVERGGQRRMMIRTPRAFQAQTRWAAFSDGSVVVSDSANYVLHVIGADGEVLRTIRHDPPAREVTEADREAEIARRRAALEDGGSGGGVVITMRSGGGGRGASASAGGGPGSSAIREMQLQQLESLEFAAVVPRVVQLAVDPRDRVWVGVAEETPGEIERIDIYEKDGSLVGRLRGVPFPTAFTGAKTAVLLDRDDLDVQQAHILRIVQG